MPHVAPKQEQNQTYLDPDSFQSSIATLSCVAGFHSHDCANTTHCPSPSSLADSAVGIALGLIIPQFIH